MKKRHVPHTQPCHQEHHHQRSTSLMFPPPRIPPVSHRSNVRNIKTSSPQQVAISPTTYHQPPPPNPPQSSNIGFNSYQQNTHNSNCHTCSHHQQVSLNISDLNVNMGYLQALSTTTTAPTWLSTLRRTGTSTATTTYSTTPAAPSCSCLSAANGAFWSSRLSCELKCILHVYKRISIKSRRQVRDAPMDSDPDDDDFSDRGRDRANRRRSYDRGQFRSRQRRNHHHSRGSSHDSRDRDHSASSSSTAQLPPSSQQQQPSPMPVQEQQQLQTAQQQQVALANNPNVGALVAQSRANNDLLSLSSVSQQLQMQGLNHT